MPVEKQEVKKKTNRGRKKGPPLTPAIKTVHLKKALLAAMAKNRCFISRSCRSVKCSRTTFQDYYKNDPDFKSAIDELTEAKIDEMEDRLEKKTRMDTVANIYWLKCKGRKRGWNERIGIDINPEGTLVPNDVVDAAVAAALLAEKERLQDAD